jgi:hypothetical protein
MENEEGFSFSTIAYWLATSLLSIAASMHKIDIVAFFWVGKSFSRIERQFCRMI